MLSPEKRRSLVVPTGALLPCSFTRVWAILRALAFPCAVGADALGGPSFPRAVGADALGGPSFPNLGCCVLLHLAEEPRLFDRKSLFPDEKKVL